MISISVTNQHSVPAPSEIWTEQEQKILDAFRGITPEHKIIQRLSAEVERGLKSFIGKPATVLNQRTMVQFAQIVLQKYQRELSLVNPNAELSISWKDEGPHGSSRKAVISARGLNSV